jgi:hypothetical protein
MNYWMVTLRFDTGEGDQFVLDTKEQCEALFDDWCERQEGAFDKVIRIDGYINNVQKTPYTHAFQADSIKSISFYEF